MTDKEEHALILEELRFIKKRLFQDNGGECHQSKLNRHDTTLKYIIGCGLFVLTAVGTLLADFIKGLVIGI